MQARLRDLEKARDKLPEVQEETERRVADLSGRMQDSFRSGDNAKALDLAKQVLALKADHAEALSVRARAESQIFLADAQGKIQASLDQLGSLLKKSEGEKDKGRYRELFTDAGWDQQVKARATQYFDSPRKLVSSRMNDVVTTVDPKGMTAGVSFVWDWAMRYGDQQVEVG